MDAETSDAEEGYQYTDEADDGYEYESDPECAEDARNEGIKSIES